MKINRLSALAALFLVGCAGDPNSPPHRDFPGHIISFSDGRPAYIVTCDAFSSMADCIKRSGQICLDTGYTTLDSRDADPGFFTPVATIHRSMTIRCNTPDGLYPGDWEKK